MLGYESGVPDEGLFAFCGRRVLLLQGPFGPFFNRLARDLRWAGAAVHKINFNGGDWLFDPVGASNFRRPLDDWPAYLAALIRDRRIDTVMLYGDCRPIHRIAAGVAKEFGLELYVFEEGYVRPDYVTLERSGVNGNSGAPRNPIAYLNMPVDEFSDPDPVGHSFWHSAGWAFLYYCAAVFLSPLFRHHVHHRRMSIADGFAWMVSLGRKPFYERIERGSLEALTGEGAPPFFLAPLQVFNDAQVTVHSDSGGVPNFIRAVVASFVRNAPADARLVFKHHPMDRGYVDYSAFFRRLTREEGLEGRLWYIHDQHLPTLLTLARGVVTINSTVGMSALHHGTPVITLGTAYYDMAGLTYQRGLDAFWRDAEAFEVNMELFRRFRAFLVRRTQINGSFSRRLPGSRVASGMRWDVSGPPGLRAGGAAPAQGRASG